MNFFGVSLKIKENVNKATRNEKLKNHNFNTDVLLFENMSVCLYLLSLNKTLFPLLKEAPPGDKPILKGPGISTHSNISFYSNEQ